MNDYSGFAPQVTGIDPTTTLDSVSITWGVDDWVSDWPATKAKVTVITGDMKKIETLTEDGATFSITPPGSEKMTFTVTDWSAALHGDKTRWRVTLTGSETFDRLKMAGTGIGLVRVPRNVTASQGEPRIDPVPTWGQSDTVENWCSRLTQAVKAAGYQIDTMPVNTTTGAWSPTATPGTDTGTLSTVCGWDGTKSPPTLWNMLAQTARMAPNPFYRPYVHAGRVSFFAPPAGVTGDLWLRRDPATGYWYVGTVPDPSMAQRVSGEEIISDTPGMETDDADLIYALTIGTHLDQSSARIQLYNATPLGDDARKANWEEAQISKQTGIRSGNELQTDIPAAMQTPNKATRWAMRTNTDGSITTGKLPTWNTAWDKWLDWAATIANAPRPTGLTVAQHGAAKTIGPLLRLCLACAPTRASGHTGEVTPIYVTESTLAGFPGYRAYCLTGATLSYTNRRGWRATPSLIPTGTGNTGGTWNSLPSNTPTLAEIHPSTRIGDIARIVHVSAETTKEE